MPSGKTGPRTQEPSGAAEHARWLNLVEEEPLDPDRPICDAHLHLFGDGQRSSTSSISGHGQYGVAEFLSERAGHNVVSSVFVETHEQFRATGPEHLRPVGETEFATRQGELCAAAGGPPMLGIVTFADLSLPLDDLQEVLRAHAAAGNGRFRGVRQNLAALPDPRMRAYSPVAEGFMGRPEFRRGLTLLGQEGYSFDASIYHPQLTELVDLAHAVPDTTIVLNHLATIVTEVEPYTDRDVVLKFWRPAMRELAKCGNVVVKLGCVGRSRLGKHGRDERATPPTSEEIAALWEPDVHWAIECFGPDRCLFESNFPTDRQWVSYGVLWNSFKRMTAGASEDELSALFHDTAGRIYRL